MGRQCRLSASRSTENPRRALRVSRDSWIATKSATSSPVPPGEECGCGIYANTRHRTGSNSYPPVFRLSAFARVALWGRVSILSINSSSAGVYALSARPAKETPFSLKFTSP